MGAETVLPFPYTQGAFQTSRDELIPLLSPEMYAACEQSGFLFDYLQYVPINEFGMPQFYAKPPRSLTNSTARNFIYPIKEGLFVHIFPDVSGARDHYIAVEPTVVTNIDHLMPQVEARLVAWAEEIGRIDDKEEKKRLLIELIDQICATSVP